MIRVLIADDDPDVRASLQTILSSAADIDVAAKQPTAPPPPRRPPTS